MLLDRAAAHSAIHRNAAARKKAQAARMAAAEKQPPSPAQARAVGVRARRDISPARISVMPRAWPAGKMA